jgi:hypothetical protein
VQVKQNVLTTQLANSSNTASDVVTHTITPTYTSSAILITCTGMGTPDTSNALYFRLLRDSTEIGSGTGADYNNVIQGMGTTQSDFEMTPFSIQFLDTPSTTSQITYKLQARANNGTAKVGGRADNNDNAVPTYITLMEIAQ